MKKYILMLSVIGLTITSCGSRSSDLAKRSKTVRVKQLTYNRVSESFQPSIGTKLMAVDTLYRQGDTISNIKGLFIITP